MVRSFYTRSLRLLLLLLLLGGAGPGRAQLLTQTLWEDLVPRSADASSASYLRLFPHQGRYLAGGCENVGGVALAWPAYLGAYSAAGQVAWRRRGSGMATCEQALLPWGAGFAFVGTENIRTGTTDIRIPFLEWFTSGGVSVRKRVLPVGQVRTTPCNALREADGGFTITGFGYDPAGPPPIDPPDAYTLTRTDSLGTVQWSRFYKYPIRAGAYPNEVLRTPRGGYLLTGFASYYDSSLPGNYTNRVWLVETDATGNLHRQVTLPVFASPVPRTQIVRTFNNTLALAGGTTYALAGYADSTDGLTTRRWGFVACFDTALQLRWTARLPAWRGAAQRTTRVRQLASGAVQVLSFGERPTPYLLLTTLHPGTGAVVETAEFAIAGLYSAAVWDWQGLADSSIVVAGSAQRLTASGGAGPTQAWLGRYKRVARLPAATAGAASLEPLRVFPSPAGAGAVVRAALPAGAGAGQLRVRDALGRVLGAARVAAGAGEAALPVGGLAPGLYLAEFVPDRADRPRAAARLELR